MPAFALEVHSPAGTSRVAVVAGPMIVGRAKDAQIFLDSRTISRRHAELTLDPFGRVWVRDLGSHNGTLVNGSKITEQVIKPGDTVQVGEFSLALVAEGKAGESSAGGGSSAGTESKRAALLESDGSRVKSLRDFEPPRLGAQHLSILSDFGAQLLMLESPVRRLEELCRLMVRPEFCGRSAVVLRASKEALTEPPKLLCTPQAAPGDETLSPYISRTLLRMLLARNEPVVASNASVPGQAGTAAPSVELSLAADVMTISAVACPIVSQPAHTDLLYVILPPAYGNSEWLALVALAVKQYQQAENNWASRRLSEEHSSIERELERARSIQTRLVPKQTLQIPGIDFAIGFVPCRWVGGDYVDIVPGKDGRVLLAIADVCGKGLPAAMVASRLHMSMHMGMKAGASLSDIMNELNGYLAETLTDGTFVTMIGALLDSNTGSVEVINAGHPAGLLIASDGQIQLTQQEANLPLGLDGAEPITAKPSDLPRGTYLVLYTDGLSELPMADGQLLGDDELARKVAGLVKTSPNNSAADLANQITALLDSLQEGMSRDDRTFLIARRV